MKKLLVTLLFISTIISCKKSNPTPTSKTDDSTKVVLDDSVSCVEISFINFTCKGDPIGTFGPCINDIDGNIYKTVIIGKQRWMAENLKVSRYNDGTVIPNIKDSSTWVNLNTPAWCYLNNDSIYNISYGKLYNWFVIGQRVIDNKNICPTGWHVPSKTEWSLLADFLGGTHIAGDKLKEYGNNSWVKGNFGKDVTNSSLFTGLPSKVRYNGSFGSEDDGAYNTWWTISEVDTKTAAEVDLSQYVPFLFNTDEDKRNGFSIRCLKD